MQKMTGNLPQTDEKQLLKQKVPGVDLGNKICCMERDERSKVSFQFE
jgi:hypothetical protein